MADIDLDDLDGPIHVPSRTSRFAPKSSKLKPQQHPKLKSNSIHQKKEEELDSPPTLADSKATAKTELESSSSSLSSAVDGGYVVKMDVEPKPEEDDGVKDDKMEEDDEGGDRVVREIDVFFNPLMDADTQLYVLQHPLRPCWRPYELDERCEEVRIKPTSAEVEVDLSVDVDSRNYDLDGDQRMRMTKQTLSSSMKPMRTTGYAVGVLVGNKLHINPIRAVVPLRPSMKHLKSGGSQKKNSVSSNSEDAKKSYLNDEKSAGFSKKQNKLPGRSNEPVNELGESWIPLKYHKAKSDFSVRFLKKMVVTESSPIQFSMSPYNYVSSLCPGDNNKAKGLSRGVLLSLPLEERFTTWFREGPPAHRFNTLKHLAPNNSIEDVFNALQKVACLVQGLWVPKSSFVLKEDRVAEVLARDYVLLLFSKSPTILEDQLKDVKSQLKKVIEGVLSTLATKRSSLGDWKFKGTPDMAFVKLYPTIVKQQEQVWERVEKSILENIFGSGRASLASNHISKPDVLSRPGTSKASSKGTVRSSNGAVSRTSMSNETREALPKALQKLFQTHKVCSFQQICQRLREMAVSESARPKGVAREAIAAANGFDAPQEELLEIINQVATNIHGIYVSKSSSDHPQYDPFRKIVIGLLIAEGPNAKLKRANIVEAAKLQLNRDIAKNEYDKVLNELCVSQGSSWILKRGDGNPK